MDGTLRSSGLQLDGESGIRTHGGVSPTHAFQACSLNHSDISPVFSVGPTVRFSLVHRCAASLQPAGSPTPMFSVGPTVRFNAVHRCAASFQPAGSPRPTGD